MVKPSRWHAVATLYGFRPDGSETSGIAGHQVEPMHVTAGHRTWAIIPGGRVHRR